MALPPSLVSKDKQRVAALIAEMRSRGLEVPEELVMQAKRVYHWPVDENGYFRKIDGTQYNATENQAGFINSNAVFSLLHGSRGSGKTAAGSQKALRKIAKGENGAILNPDFENFRISTWPSFKEWIPWEMVVPKHQYRKSESWQPLQPFRLTFKNGVSVICKGLKDPDSARGPNINWLWYDEAGRDTNGISWKVALASVRIGKEIQAWATTTPKGKSHWVNEFFIEKKIPEDALEAFEKLQEGRPLVESFKGTIYENEKNLNPVFMASMLATYPSGYLRKQEIFGEFVDAGGTLGDRSWFDGRIIASPLEQVYKRIRYWDLAGTEKKMVGGKLANDPDETVGTLLSWDKKNFYIENQACGFLEWDGVLTLIRDTAIKDGIAVPVIVEQEPAAGGKNQVAAIHNYLREQIPGHPGCEGWRPDQDRVILANIWFAEANQGKFFAVDGKWLEPFLGQLDEFPDAKHDDKITSVTGARLNVAPIALWKDIPFLSL